MSDSRLIREIVSELQVKGVIEYNEYVISERKGTTDGSVYVLAANGEPKYVLKLDSPQQIAMAERFYFAYSGTDLLPKLLHSNSAEALLLYEYLAGETHYNRGPKNEWLPLLVEGLLNHYQKVPAEEEWGRLQIPRQSWREFHERSVEGWRSRAGELLPAEDLEWVQALVANITADDEEKLLLHGDTGVHNFVFRSLRLKGVIDPSPMIGPARYDLLYAFCSSPDDLSLETLLAAYKLLRHEHVETSRLIEETAIQLYCRIGICSLHHPHDLPGYLQAWDYWKGLLSRHGQ
ncbi:phosphotransferase [Paenibacillus sp. MBLB4367]|uniref:phosphotransferase n=1 Tax=Paenibacillus sp. MBLB4367 TaxID=3384767 RepID=UPI0039080AAA